MTEQPTALVTGSAGFVGRHLVDELTDAGYRVLGLDLLPWPRLRRPAGYAHFRIDALDWLRSRFPAGVDLVIHAAAVVGGRTMIDGAPAELAAVDLELDAALWRWALRARPRRIVYLSSSAAYPVSLQTVNGHALEEADLDPLAPAMLAPDNTYGLVKLVGERMAAEVRAAGVAVTVVRPFSGYGHDQAADYPFPAFIARAAAGHGTPGRRPFAVWGNGAQVRDFIHIDDTVAAIVRLAELGVDGPVNLGTGRPTSLDDLAVAICSQLGYRPQLEHDLCPPVGVAYRVAPTETPDRYYTPQVTLEDGIARALAEAAR